VKTFDNLGVEVDCVTIAVAHDGFKKIGFKDVGKFMNTKPVIIDVRGMFDGEEAKKNDFYYKSL